VIVTVSPGSDAGSTSPASLVDVVRPTSAIVAHAYCGTPFSSSTRNVVARAAPAVHTAIATASSVTARIAPR
jgi:hypothetical protein